MPEMVSRVLGMVSRVVLSLFVCVDFYTYRMGELFYTTR
jgi:hypothetical protein